MSWLLYTLVQVFITIGFLALALHTAPSPYSVLFLLGSGLFFFRSINHPDFWLRRGFLMCLMLGCAHLALGNILELDPASFHPFWQLVIGIVKALLSPGPWIGFGLLIVASLFAILELVRMYILGAETFGDRAFVQISEVTEIYSDEYFTQSIKIVAEITNNCSTDVTLTWGTVTKYGIFPLTRLAQIDILKGAVEIPGRPELKIEANKSATVLAVATFKMWPFTLRSIRMGVLRTALYQWAFGFRSLSFRTRSKSGFAILAKDTVRRSD